MPFQSSKWHVPLKLKRSNSVLKRENLDEYQPKTLHKYNQQRRQFLPTFPIEKDQSMDQAPLLLANVPAQKLSFTELTRRHSAVYHDPFDTTFVQITPSYIYTLYENLFDPLKEKLQVDAAILDYNLYRLHHMIHHFIGKYRTYERSNILYDHHFHLPVHEQNLRMLNQYELIILLEFFLQIDVDLFFMNTYTFLPTQKVHGNHQLFSTNEIHNSFYEEMKPCKQLFCTVCQSNTVDFLKEGQKHCFLNGYETILNCSATCQTNGIIYVLTCVCGEYDYISSTQYGLADVLEYHRQHANRIMIEYLLNGEPFSNLCTCTKNRFDKVRANKMRLYEHLTHCRKALQLFLEHNPNYWCFIPMKMSDAQFDDLSYAAVSTDESDFISHVPKPPQGYLFSKRQRAEQYEFFQTFNPKQSHLYSTLDFYRMAIIAVLPHTCSTMLRHMIEILLVTHAETKLNPMNLLTSDTNLLYGLPYNEERIWCENLVCPSLSHYLSSINVSSFSKCE